MATSFTEDLSESFDEEELRLIYGINDADVHHILETHLIIQSEGIFGQFVKDLLETLSSSKYSKHTLKRYLRVLAKELDGLEYRFANKLGRYVKGLAKDSQEGMRDQIRELLEEYNANTKFPRRMAFLNAINKVYTLRENIMFRNYIADVKDYGHELIPFIEEQTRKIINDVILKPILEMTFNDRKDLSRKLRAAYREYSNNEQFHFEV